MKARVDPTRCQGYGVCVEVAPKEFVFDDWGFSQSILVDATGEHAEAVERAVQRCPIEAIRWIDETPS